MKILAYKEAAALAAKINRGFGEWLHIATYPDFVRLSRCQDGSGTEKTIDCYPEGWQLVGWGKAIRPYPANI